MANIPFIIDSSDAKEDIIETDPYKYAIKTAKKKSIDLLKKHKSDIILTCDTVVYIDGNILGKPKDFNDCYKMIKMISGKCHEVITGVFIGNNDNNDSFFVSTKVYVSKMTDEEILEYINTKEPYDKAGGYAIQGLFGKFIERIEGDYYNVVGLPLNEVYNTLKKYKK